MLCITLRGRFWLEHPGQQLKKGFTVVLSNSLQNGSAITKNCDAPGWVGTYSLDVVLMGCWSSSALHSEPSPQLHYSTTPQVHKLTSPQIDKSTSWQVHKLTRPQVDRSTSPRVHKSISPRVHKSTSLQVHKFTSASQLVQ